MIKNLLVCLFLLGCALFQGCKSLKPVQQPSSLSMPSQFPNQGDSAGIGQLRPKELFADSHLVHLIDTALQNNFDLKRAYQRVQMARAQLLFGRRRFLPSLNFNASAGAERYGDYTMNGVGNYDSNLSPNLNEDQKIPTSPTTDFFMGLRSGWEIGLWGKYRNTRKAAFERFLASEKGRHLVMTSLVSEVANRYYDLLALDNELLTIRKNVALQQTALQTIQEMKLGAMSNELAVKQFQAQLMNTQGLEAQMLQEILRTENDLNLLLGRLPQSIPRGLPITQQPFPENVQTGLPSSLLARRPDIQEAERRLAAAKLDVRVAKAAFFPSLRLTAYGGYNSFKAPLLFSTPASLAYGAIGGLTAPLFNRGLLLSNYKNRQAVQLEAFYYYQKTIANGYKETITHMNGIQNFRRAYTLKQGEVGHLNDAVNVSKDLFMAGYASYLEVITAQRLVLQAELELSEVKKKQFFSLIDLYRSLGGGWE